MKRFTDQKHTLIEFTHTIKPIEATIQQTAAAAEETSSLVKQMSSQSFRIKDSTHHIEGVLGLAS